MEQCAYLLTLRTYNMGRTKLQSEHLQKVTIEKVAAEGKCLARVHNKVVFVSHVAPGDVVDLRVTKRKKRHFEAVPTHFHSYSPDRVEPFCAHFGLCGGCKWQHLPYQTQLAHKQAEVQDQLERIGKVALPPIAPILPSAQTQFYRNKLEFTFSHFRWLEPQEVAQKEAAELRGVGFHVPGRWDRVMHISKCWLQPEPSNQIRLAIHNYALAHNLSYYNLKEQHGLLRGMVLRNTNTGQFMLIVQFGQEEPALIKGLLSHLQETFPQISSLYYVVNTKANDTFHDLDLQLFAGKPHIIEQMEDLQFMVGPKSFYQTNAQQAYELYKVARNYAELQGHERVYDLYTGTGTIANFVARQAKEVVGLEYVPEAIEDAKANSQLNGIDNTRFFAGDMKDLLSADFLAQQGQPDVVITDPPRAGMHPKVVEMLLQAAPQKIVYVSCNAATQARDLALLDEAYQVTKVQPVDMFPQTHHVENVVQLVKR